MGDPDVIPRVDGDADDGADDPVVRQRLRPGRIDGIGGRALQASLVARLKASRSIGSRCEKRDDATAARSRLISSYPRATRIGDVSAARERQLAPVAVEIRRIEPAPERRVERRPFASIIAYQAVSRFRPLSTRAWRKIPSYENPSAAPPRAMAHSAHCTSTRNGGSRDRTRASSSSTSPRWRRSVRCNCGE